MVINESVLVSSFFFLFKKIFPFPCWMFALFKNKDRYKKPTFWRGLLDLRNHKYDWLLK